MLLFFDSQALIGRTNCALDFIFLVHRPVNSIIMFQYSQDHIAFSVLEDRLVSCSPHQLPSVPRPMDVLQSSVPPPFLTKTYDMVDDPVTDDIISWSSTSNSFVVWKPSDFSRDLLPKFFKHNTFSSFVRQLNTYGFRKVNPDRWEFASEGFLRGQRQLLKTIRRRKSVQCHVQAASLEIDGYGGMENEIQRLGREKSVLTLELVKMRQQQQATERELRMMEQRLNMTEQRQAQMMSFLAKAMQNPTFLSQLLHQNSINKRSDAANKKRRLPEHQTVSAKQMNPDMSSLEHSAGIGIVQPKLAESFQSWDSSAGHVATTYRSDGDGFHEFEGTDGFYYSSPESQAEILEADMQARASAASIAHSQGGSQRGKSGAHDLQAVPILSEEKTEGVLFAMNPRNFEVGDFFLSKVVGFVDAHDTEEKTNVGLQCAATAIKSLWEPILGGKISSEG